MPESWYKIENKAGKTPEVMIFGPIGGSFFEDGVEASSFIKEVKALSDPKEIIFNVNSPGGQAFQGFAIYNFLVGMKDTKKIMKVNLAASIASVIAMAGDEIQMPKNGMFMIHLPTGGASGNADDMRRMASVLDKITESIVDIYAQKTGLSVEVVKTMVQDETWMSAEEAKKLGFATEIIDAIPITNLLPGFFNTIPTPKKEDKKMSEETKADLVSVTAPVIDRAYIELNCKEIVAAIRSEAAADERKRITAIHATGMPGCESTIAALMSDPTKSEIDALRATLDHLKLTGAKALADIRADAPLPVPPDASTASGETILNGTEFTAKVTELVAKGMTKSKAMSQVVAQYPELHAAYVASANKRKGV